MHCVRSPEKVQELKFRGLGIGYSREAHGYINKRIVVVFLSYKQKANSTLSVSNALFYIILVLIL